MTIPQALALALQHHQAGRLREAEALCRQILAAEPRHAEVWHQLGIMAHQVGRHDLAVKWIGQALAIEPGNSAGHSNLGEAFRTMGRLEDAIAEYHRAIQLQPDCAEAYSNLGNALRNQDRLEEAAAACRRAIQLNPGYAEPHNNLGIALQEQSRGEEAIAAYRRAIDLKPGYAEAHNNLGIALQEQGRGEEAIAAYRRAIDLKPGYAEAHNNLGNALRDQGCLDEAVAALRRAIQLKPRCAEAHNNLGNALRDQGHIDEATAAYRQAIHLRPDFAGAHSNLGNALRDQGRLDEAIAACRHAIQLKPGWADAKWHASLALLLRGDFEQGLPLFEARWDVNDFKFAKRNFPCPMWKGEALHDQRVLLHAEQGLGDTLQFIRYAPLVAQRGGHVIVECQRGLKTLLASVGGIPQIIEPGEPLPEFDLHCPLMSLPLALGTRVETIPAAIPYLRTDALKAARWRERLEHLPASLREALWAGDINLTGAVDFSQGSPLNVGLVWAGGERPHQPKLRPVDQRRSMHLSQFAPLATVSGAVFVSLQKGPPAAQAKSPPEGMRLLDWTNELEDFSDTAALVEALDLVISVDTAVAHLAGALGKPVWLLNRFDTCWRWLTEREDSPWYPTMRLFRQPRFMDWEPVMARVREQLQTLAQAHSNPSSRQP